MFIDPAEFRRFLAILDQTTRRFRWQCLAYCLMTNHYHLVVRTPEPNISQAMHHLNGAYARWFNRRHGYQGHLLQRRFHAAAIESDWHLLEACRYVVLNPVRAGLVRAPIQWPWSSYRATIGAPGDASGLALDELLGFFGRRRGSAREAFRAFVDDAPERRPS
jgi:REP element-mobilizing transposase RayT